MATRKKKTGASLAAILMAAAMMVTSVPHTTMYAAEVSDETKTESTESSAESTGDSAEDNGETVLEDGEVVMEGAVGKVDKSEWITLDDYELVAENDSYKMYLYAPRLSVILGMILCIASSHIVG
mgnify:CR=1 FL=1